jgi:hypothetical protein
MNGLMTVFFISISLLSQIAEAITLIGLYHTIAPPTSTCTSFPAKIPMGIGVFKPPFL